VVARTVARTAPLVLIAGLAVFFLARSAGLGTGSARGFAEAIPLNVASSEGGRLIELTVTIGQDVKAGDAIAKLDGRALDLEHKRAEAEQAMLEAKLLAETSKEDDSVMRAEVWRLRTVAGSQQDQAALSALDKEVGRLNGLLDDKLVKASDVEPRVREREALAARVGTFERARVAGQAGLEEKGRAGADKHKAVVQLRTAPLREALRVSQATLAQIDLKIASLTLRAPADGIVSLINRRPGEIVAAGEAAVVIIGHRPGVFEIYVPAREPRMPAVGMTAFVSRAGLGLFGKSFRGRVIEVAPTVIEMPERLRSSPHVPIWGRLIRVDASDSDVMRAVPPGEEIHVRI
jgi:multidrug resistance efflux pump